MKPSTDIKGFSLVEVIVATAILAIVVVVVASAFVAMGNISAKTSGNKSSDSGLQASIAAKEGLEGDIVTYSASEPLEFSVPGVPGSFSLPLEAHEYSSAEEGSSFTLFGLGPSTP